METRKIQSVGGGTYTVSLPKDWAESAGIAAGTVVDLHTHIDDLLVIQPQERQEEGSATVEITLADEDATFVERTLRAAYAVGVREVVLDAPDGIDPSQRRTVERVTRTLTGVAIVEESDTKLVVRTMLDAEEVSVRQSVRQLQFVTLSMHREATQALTGQTRVENPHERDDQADRLYALVDRYFERGLARLDEIDHLGVTRPDLFTLWLTARELERIADHAERIARLGATVTPSASTGAELTRLADAARQTVSDAVRVAIGDADATVAREALDRRGRVREDAADLERRLFESDDSDYRLARVLDSLSRTAEHGGNIAELGLQRVIRDGELAGRSELATDVHSSS
ncbi:MAG: PhoU domain-containing protein [Halapricum sp.]